MFTTHEKRKLIAVSWLAPARPLYNGRLGQNQLNLLQPRITVQLRLEPVNFSSGHNPYLYITGSYRGLANSTENRGSFIFGNVKWSCYTSQLKYVF